MSRDCFAVAVGFVKSLCNNHVMESLVSRRQVLQRLPFNNISLQITQWLLNHGLVQWHKPSVETILLIERGLWLWSWTTLCFVVHMKKRLSVKRKIPLAPVALRCMFWCFKTSITFRPFHGREIRKRKKAFSNDKRC